MDSTITGMMRQYTMMSLACQTAKLAKDDAQAISIIMGAGLIIAGLRADNPRPTDVPRPGAFTFEVGTEDATTHDVYIIPRSASEPQTFADVVKRVFGDNVTVFTADEIFGDDPADDDSADTAEYDAEPLNDNDPTITRSYN